MNNLTPHFKSHAAEGPSRRDIITLFNDIWHGSVTSVQHYIKKYPHHLDVRDPSGKTGQTPLIFAIALERSGVADLLINSGANVDQGDTNGDTPLIWTAYRNNFFIADKLLKNGADAARGNASGNTAAHRAAVDGHAGLLQLLHVRNNALIHQKNHDGNTPLHLAAFCGAGKIVAWILARGADMEALNSHGQTPLIRAAAGQNLNTLSALIAGGANLNAVDYGGWDAMRHARYKDDKPVIALLEEAPRIRARWIAAEKIRQEETARQHQDVLTNGIVPDSSLSVRIKFKNPDKLQDGKGGP